MIDRATHWFYAERQLSAGATVENLRHDLWANGFYNIWLSLKKMEQSPSPEDGIDSSFGGNQPPYLLSGLWGQNKFEIEFEPRKFLMIRAAKENEWLKKAFTRALGMGPHFQFQDKSGQFILEWHMADREARWQSMQGVPAYKNLKRLYAVAES